LIFQLLFNVLIVFIISVYFHSGSSTVSKEQHDTLYVCACLLDTLSSVY